MSKYIKIIILLVLSWLAYNTIFFPPKQVKMNKLIQNQTKIKNFSDGFEGEENLTSLFKKDFSRWHEIIQQNNSRSLKRPLLFCMVNPYDCKLTLTNKEENNLKIEKNIIHSGRKSLKFKTSKFKRQWLGGSKIAIRQNLLNFKKGDDFYFSAWYYIKDEENIKVDNNHNFISLFALRSANKNIRHHGEPGMELFLEKRNYAYFDLTKWLPKPEPMKQTLSDETSIPRNKWFQLKIHLKLSDDKNLGLGELWIDDKKVIQEKGQTLPEASTIYSILELGIVNNTNDEYAQIIYMDDIYVSDSGFIPDFTK